LIDGDFSYYCAHIKVYRYWPFGVVNPKKLPSAGETLNLLPLLLRAADGVKTDILIIMRAYCVGGMIAGA
jgi:hypothetical protein